MSVTSLTTLPMPVRGGPLHASSRAEQSRTEQNVGWDETMEKSEGRATVGNKQTLTQLDRRMGKMRSWLSYSAGLVVIGSLFGFADGSLFVMEEYLEARTLVVKFGSIPDFVNGTLYMNGPMLHDFNAFGLDLETKHFFDGASGLVSLDFEHGRVGLRSRFLETESFMRIIRHGQLDFATFGTPLSWRSLLLPPFGFVTDNTNVNLYYANGHLYATSDIVCRTEINPKTLETIRRFSRHETYGKFILGAAHPGIANATHVYNYVGPTWVNPFTMTGTYDLTLESHDENGIHRKVIGTVDAPVPWLVHSVGLSERFVLYGIISMRASISPWMDLSLVSNMMRFHPNINASYVVVDRDSHNINRVSCNESFNSLHIVNAFDLPDGNNVVLDVCANRNEFPVELFTHGYRLESFEQDHLSMMYTRCVISLHSCGCRDLLEIPFEFPVINPNFRGRQHRYVYAVTTNTKIMSPWSDQILKIDIVKTATTIWDAPENMVVGEPRFIPNTKGSNIEDDGVLVAILTHTRRASSQLVVLNATDLDVIALCDLPSQFPLLIHGVFLDRSSDGSPKFYPNP